MQVELTLSELEKINKKISELKNEKYTFHKININRSESNGIGYNLDFSIDMTLLGGAAVLTFPITTDESW